MDQHIQAAINVRHAMKVVARFEIFNVEARSTEKLLHFYFDNLRAEITIPDRFGTPVKSCRLLIVPRAAIKATAERLIDRSLIEPPYDALSIKTRSRPKM